MAEQFHFELVSPERLLMDMKAAHVIVPGSEGEFGVLPGHAPLMSTLRPGLIEVFETEDEAPKRLFLKGGLAEVNAQGLTVLAEDSVDPDGITLADLEEQIRHVREDLADAGDDALARRKAEAALRWMEPLREILARS